MDLIKKYSNRRLYDTVKSRYIALEELAETIRGGTDVRVVDAKTGADLTQITLAQIIFESKNAARLLPVPLLVQLIRLSDNLLAEFMGQYVSAALDLYLQMKQGAQSLAPYLPFGSLPFGPASAFSRFFGAGAAAAPPTTAAPAPAPTAWPAPAAAPAPESDVAAMRRELDELKAALGGGPAKPKPKRRK
ncbi:MAG TPA: polyhydroxyalkanoate synthesis regulator DNA-binding domain-containing protein [Polyangia bacterium]|jgi:polyhydroxyalkanoate synthesis repressor PhaR